MSKDEILSSLKLNKYQQYCCVFYSKLFQNEIELAIDVYGDPNQKITENTIQTIQDFLQWDKHKLIEIQNGIWQNCLNCNADDRYSFDGGKTWVETKLTENLNKYNIKTKEDALEQAQIVGAFISNKMSVPGKSISLACETTWDPEHGINFNFVDNELREIA